MAAGHKALMQFIKNPKGCPHEKSGCVAEVCRKFLNSMETESQKPSEYGEFKNMKSFVSVSARKIEWQLHRPRRDMENETIVQGGGQERKNGFQKSFQISISCGSPQFS